MHYLPGISVQEKRTTRQPFFNLRKIGTTCQPFFSFTRLQQPVQRSTFVGNKGVPL